MKIKNLLVGAVTILALIGCGSSDEDTVNKYLPGTYTRINIDDKQPVAFGFYKELTIKHLKGNEYRITCLDRDWHWNEEKPTPDTFDFEISSITLNEKSDSINKYYIKGIVTNIVHNGSSFSYADQGINYSGAITLTIGKNEVEAQISGVGLSSIRKK